MLVFSVDDVQSFKEMSDLWQEICERRPDINELPVVVVGNKCDVPSKKIFEATATAFTSRLSADVRYIEASAKENIRVTDIFRTLLELSGFPRCKAGGGALEDIPQNENAKDWDVTGGLSLLRRVNTARARSSNRTLPKAPDESVNKGNLSHRDHLEKQSTHPTLSLPPEESTLKRHASLRISRSNKQDKEKEQLQRKISDDGSKLIRSSSLIRRTKHLSLKMRRPGEKGANEEKEDESDCKIS
ncbi:hypothetical protein WR25_21683 [Diploscapter pachys]|uniref:Uncharacterized protein n=1 Tax=Diploscapter pachys TaxID=2018661 RepID=A0A2A2LBT0_9BILA|nr:hypothetical protein WR25_21683 [Diploscapter pachys]